MLGDFGFSHVQVHLHALFEQFRCLGGVAEEQLAHHAVGGHFVQVTAAEVGEFVVVRGLHEFHGFVVLHVHCLRVGLERFVFRYHFTVFQFLEHLAVGTGGDVRENGYGLQLGRTFVNRSDAGVAVQALASVFEHVAGTAVHLDAVVAVQVGVLGVHAVTRPFGSRLTLAPPQLNAWGFGAHSVLVDMFASRASVNTELVFDAADIHATVLLRPLGSIVR